jgi:peptidoglycan/LPS O-acetylase OafA/YrhL
LVFLHHTCATATDELKSAGGLQWLTASFAEAGAFGVDLFFLLSAYLITEILLRERKLTGAINVRDFYMRRILRIWPLYFSFVTFCFVIQWFTPSTFPLEGLLAFIFLAGNWYCTGGFPISPVAPLWSVSIEEQFYLLWPLAVRHLSRLGMILVACTLVAVAFATRWYLLSGYVERSVVWCNTFARLDPIAVGILTAVVLDGRLPRISRWLRASLIPAGIMIIFLGAWKFRVLDSAIPVLDGMVGYPCGTVGSWLIFIGFLGAPLDGLKLPTYQWVLYLGRISYGLYVFHLFSLDAVKFLLLHFLGTSPVWLRGIAGLLLTIALASASYRWLEVPFLRLKKRFAHVALATGDLATPKAAV